MRKVPFLVLTGPTVHESKQRSNKVVDVILEVNCSGSTEKENFPS